jgi:hypothetical protein
MLGDRTIRYDQVTRAEGGFSAGAHDMRDNSTVLYGIYVQYQGKNDPGRHDEEWAWILDPEQAAEMIRRRAPLARASQPRATPDEAPCIHSSPWLGGHPVARSDDRVPPANRG